LIVLLPQLGKDLEIGTVECVDARNNVGLHRGDDLQVKDAGDRGRFSSSVNFSAACAGAARRRRPGSSVLENLVHMSRQDYPTGYVVVAAIVPVHVRIIEHHRYLDAKSPDAALERTAGDKWLQSGEAAVLRVPSAVVAGDWNYLINPQRLEFAQISIEPPEPLKFDERLFEGT